RMRTPTAAFPSRSAAALERARSLFHVEPRGSKPTPQRRGVEAIAQAVQLARHGAVRELRADAYRLRVRDVLARECALYRLPRDRHARLLELCEEAHRVCLRRPCGEVRNELVARCHRLAPSGNDPIAKDIGVRIERVEQVDLVDPDAPNSDRARGRV